MFVLSIAWIDPNMSISSLPFGNFKSYEEAELFAISKIDEIKKDYIEAYDDEEYINDMLQFSFKIKKLFN